MLAADLAELGDQLEVVNGEPAIISAPFCNRAEPSPSAHRSLTRCSFEQMRLAMRIEMSGWSIVVPDGWTTVIGDSQGWLRLFLDAKVHHDEGSLKIAKTGVDLYFECIHPPTISTIADYADGVMRRHVGQGAPDISSRNVCGREARAYQWTDGVQNIESVFVEIPESTHFTVLRLDVFTPSFEADIAARGRVAASRVLESLTWH